MGYGVATRISAVVTNPVTKGISIGGGLYDGLYRGPLT